MKTNGIILFKNYHIPFIQEGIKIQTRRNLGRKFIEDGIYRIKTKLYERQDYGYMQIKSVREQRLGDITESDANNEGYYDIESYISAYEEIYNEKWNPDKTVQVIDFVFLEDK